jgi:hypothetical protein
MTPTQADLKDRARELVHRMHDVERWAYAIDFAAGTKLPAALTEAGYRIAEEDDEAHVVRFEAGDDSADGLVMLGREDLEVVLLQAYGPGTVDRLGPVLEATGFVPQSKLLAEAYAVGEPRARAALTTLAHMVVRWDEDWADLFLLHLASPDPIARHDAVLATVVAAFSARQGEPARSLLAEALTRETFPKLKDTLNEAVKAVDGLLDKQLGSLP